MPSRITLNKGDSCNTSLLCHHFFSTMRRLHPCLFVMVALFYTACKTTQPGSAPSDNQKIDITFLQINDVYEIAPLSGGREGGIARVATLKNEYLWKNPTYLVMA